MYKLIKFRDEVVGASKQDGNISVSFTFEDPDNTDYQAFLKYQAEGGKVYGADEEVPDGQANQ